MADEGFSIAHQVADQHDVHHGTGTSTAIPQMPSRKSTFTKGSFEPVVRVRSATATPSANTLYNGAHRTSRHIIEFDEYFVGPRDLNSHSKLPFFMRLHGSVMPRMILPLFMVSAWATFITAISKYVHVLAVNTVLLTVLGFVVGLALSFRSTTAYERYSDGRKAWATLSVQSRNMARCIWIHVKEREGELGKQDLLSKLTAINLINAFAVSLKHYLRFEPYAHYADMEPLVGHLDTFAKAAEDPDRVPKTRGFWKRLGEQLGLSLAATNPRKALKKATQPLGNLPLEILMYMNSFVDQANQNKTLDNPVVLGQILTSIATLTDTMANAERVLSTPLPVGYNILFSQIVLLYVYLLPFQLYGALGWITIPGTVAAAYIIIGLHAIGNELENPFGNDVNDLPLDRYCTDLAMEMDIITSVPAPSFDTVMELTQVENKVLYPLSMSGYSEWSKRSESDIRSALRSKVIIGGARPVTARPATNSNNEKTAIDSMES